MFAAFRHLSAIACLTFLAALSLQAAPVIAQDGRARGGISEDAAVALVREQTDGKVVRVERKVEGGVLVYRIRVLKPDGRLREYRVDAETGSVR